MDRKCNVIWKKKVSSTILINDHAAITTDYDNSLCNSNDESSDYSCECSCECSCDLSSDCSIKSKNNHLYCCTCNTACDESSDYSCKSSNSVLDSCTCKKSETNHPIVNDKKLNNDSSECECKWKKSITTDSLFICSCKSWLSDELFEFYDKFSTYKQYFYQNYKFIKNHIQW